MVKENEKKKELFESEEDTVNFLREALPNRPVSRISRLMKLWHESPERATRFINPRHAEELWGVSKAASMPALDYEKDDIELKALWLKTPEKAMRYIDPDEALFRYGAPEGMTRIRFNHLKLLYNRLHEVKPEPPKAD